MLLVVLGLLAALVGLGFPAQAGAARPNVVVIMTDDQTYADLSAMPLTRQLVGDAGATFERAYVSYPLCCPSRATFLTGQYAHNHGVLSTVPPLGGVEALRAAHTLPVWLREAGYETIHIGKYLNGYGLRTAPDVPPGWTDWRGTVDKSTYQMYGYQLYENGLLRTYGDFWAPDPALYQTDVLGAKAVEAIEERAFSRRPLFLSLAFVAPHGESVEPGASTRPYIRPAPRHAGRFDWVGTPLAALGERDVRDKPPYVRGLRRIGPVTADRITYDFQARRESLLAVDEAVSGVIAALERTGRLANTYVLFTSDNGFFHGEHRITKGKYLAYEPSTHVPLLMRGPGIPAGTVSHELVANTDLAATVLDVAGARADIPQDGRSLLPYARDGALRSSRPLLHEALASSSIGSYRGVRTDRFLYVRWDGGARELYDLWADPNEMHSVHRERAYAGVRRQLAAELARLRDCVGPACSAPAQASRR